MQSKGRLLAALFLWCPAYPGNLSRFCVDGLRLLRQFMLHLHAHLVGPQTRCAIGVQLDIRVDVFEHRGVILLSYDDRGTRSRGFSMLAGLYSFQARSGVRGRLGVLPTTPCFARKKRGSRKTGSLGRYLFGLRLEGVANPYANVTQELILLRQAIL